MPRLKPLDKLVNKARRLRDHHQERHRPSGFGFALAPPNMVLEISPKWKTYDGYRARLTSRYRKGAEQIEKEFAAGGLQLTHLSNANDGADHQILTPTKQWGLTSPAPPPDVRRGYASPELSSATRTTVQTAKY